MARKRRIRSPHPGVKLKRRGLPSGGVSWRAHYVDVDTGREVAVTLDPLALSTAEARTQWAKTKAADLARIRMERAAGVEPIERTDLDKAIEAFTTDPHKRDSTNESHAAALAIMQAWAKRSGVKTTADLTRGKLAQLRDEIIRAPRRNAAKGGKRGSKSAEDGARSPYTINRELASVRAAVNAWRKRGEVRLTKDEILETLALVSTPKDVAAYLRPHELQRLLDAALRHDAATFTMTRAEARGGGRGQTPKHSPIAPVVALLLLTGMRRGEALGLRWRDIDLDARDHQGSVVGEIRLMAKATKTNRGRTIGLEVSPALRRMLATMKLQGGRGYVLGGREPLTPEMLRRAVDRLVNEYGAPPWSPQLLRSTAACYLTNSPGIFGAASVFLSARMLGHSVGVAERHYLDVMRGISKTARTLEAAYQIEAQLGALQAELTVGRVARA